MKARILFDKILEKIDIEPEKRNQYYDRLNSISNFDIPDDFEEVISKFETLHSERSALASRQIADKVFDKRKKDIDKAMSARLAEMDFSRNEIDEVLSLPFEERASKIASITFEKAKSKYNITESERIKQETEAARRERERADRLQQQLLESEKRLKQDYEREKANIRLQYLINSFPKSDVLPPEKANSLIMNEIQGMLVRDNAKIMEIGGMLKVVSADDESQDVYDERNMRVSVEDYIKRAIRDSRLEPKESKPIPKIATVTMNHGNGQKRVNSFLQNFASNLI
jgi:nitrous oxide reductase